MQIVLFKMLYMLSEPEQIILLELLLHGKLNRNWFLKNTNFFSNTPDFFKRMAKLKDYGLIMNDGKIDRFKQKDYFLTFKGEIRAKLIALDRNNPKNYTINLRSELIDFEYNP